MGATGVFDENSDFNAFPGNTYFIQATCTATLPSSSSSPPAVNGAEISFIIDGAFNLTIQAATGQTIQIATSISSTTGTQTNTMNGDACTLKYSSNDTKWMAQSAIGAWNAT